MNNLIINKLYIFSIREKKAKVIEFDKETNVITSSRINGTKRGKSLILKSLYYVLGADSFFDSAWNVKSKTYIAEITIRGGRYFFYRQDDFFKIFDSNKKLLVSVQERSKLAEYLSELYNFRIKLPGRNGGELKLAKPVYSYLFNFIDQDKMNGPSFVSFDKLGEFENFKVNLIYSQLGVFNEEYYGLIQESEVKNEEKNSCKKRCELASAMFEKIEIDLDGETYPNSADALEIEISQSQDEYNKYSNELRGIKQNLIKLRNNQTTVQTELNILKKFLKNGEKDIQHIEKDICPECYSEITLPLKTKIQKYNSVDDLYLLFSQLNSELVKILGDIDKKQENYHDILQSLKRYEERLKVNSRKNQEILKHKGLIIIRDDLLKEKMELDICLNKLDEEIKMLKKKLKKYEQSKKEVNELYYSLMKETKEYFDLEEIDEKILRNIGSTFTAGGSSKTLATVMWHFNLLKLRSKFNPTAIKFPIVLDSPNNVETDLERKTKMFNFIFTEKEKEVQLIVSALGFHEEDNSNLQIKKIIVLANESYNLLNEADFEANQELLNELILCDFEVGGENELGR